MAGQSAGHTVEGIRDWLKIPQRDIREHGGISADETSAIGGMGRKGSDGYGRSEAAPHHCIAEEFIDNMGGNATTGTTGYNSGYGKTFSGKKSKSE